MKLITALVYILTVAAISEAVRPAFGQQDNIDMTEAMKQSVVYLDISCYAYDQFRPWEQSDIVQRPGTGIAVGKYEVITPTWNLADAKLVKARWFGQNEFIPAAVKVIDYESNLSLLQLDPNAMSRPLTPLKFSEDYRKGAQLSYYWLSAGGQLTTGRGYLDRARMYFSKISYLRTLTYVVTNTSKRTGIGQVYCNGSKPIGIACWSEKTKEAGLIPGVIINKFLADAADGGYKGFGAVGFATSNLLDPTMRLFLKVPPAVKGGVYVSDVYNMGTGSDVLKKADVILGIDGQTLDPYGRFIHPEYEQLSFHHLITSKAVGDTVSFELWRDGRRVQLETKIVNFKASQMLIPFHEYGQQPEYIVTAGFVIGKLTRPYLTNWGENWPGRVSAHFYHYYRDMAFKPTEQRRDIVILSYVLPAEINLGYKDLRQMVIKKFNGMTIRSIEDIPKVQKLNPESRYDVIEFELDKPVVVIPRKQLPAADLLIRRNYGIDKPVNINR